VDLWSNVGDIVFTPFLGIGSEAYQALKMHRRAVGIELKNSYFKQAVENCKQAELNPDFENLEITDDEERIIDIFDLI